MSMDFNSSVLKKVIKQNTTFVQNQQEGHQKVL